MRRAPILILILMACTLVYAVARTARIVLPTGWLISPPTGPVGTTGTMPQGIALSPDGQLVAVLESGAGPAGLRVFESATLRERIYVALKGAFGNPVWDGNDHLWVALANQHAIGRVSLARAALDRSVDTGADSWPAAVALAPDGKTAAFSDDASAHVGIVDIAANAITARIPTDRHPGALTYSPDGTFVATVNRGGRTITLINAVNAQARTIDVGLHPSALAFSADGSRIFVTLADEDALVTVDTATAKISGRTALGLNAYPGSSPNAIALARDGTAFVTCGAINAFAVVADGKRTGFIPAGWYPDGIAVDAAKTFAFVLNGKGEGSHPNPQFNPFAGRFQGYVATGLQGSLRKISLQPGVQTAAVVANMEAASAPPPQTVLRRNGPIKHVIYIIKENRSYDQVLSDMPGGDGDPQLLLFGAGITPNEHAIARRFGLLDRAFANAQVSADGHNWTDAAFANDYLERFWPPVYGNRRDLYDFEDGAGASVPRSGFLWDAAARANVTYRNYGEFVTNPSTTGSEVTTAMPHLKNHTSSAYPGFDLEFSDLNRVAIWLREFRSFSAAGNLPSLEIIRLPNDHTAGTKPGTLTPEAFVAQNDYAFGEIVDAVSHSQFWRSSLIIATEDDAQNGPDHVDAQRTTSYIASPYARGGVDHTRYSTASLVRTIEIVLGLPALSMYDAHAQPLYRALTSKPNFASFTAYKPLIDITATNKRTAYGSAASARMDFRTEDVNDPAVLNEILYRDHASRARKH